jgi:hypothetical protein
MAISEYRNGSNYVFFENRYGFKFVSLETLFSQKPKDKYVINLANILDYNKNQVDPIENTNQQFTVLDFKSTTNIDMLSNLMNGTFGNRLITYDPIRKKIHDNILNYNNHFDKVQHIDKNIG